jgi:IS1 family transposase
MAPAPQTLGQAHTQQSDSQPSNWRTRMKRLGRRTMGFSTTPMMPDLGLGRFINRDELGGAI